MVIEVCPKGVALKGGDPLSIYSSLHAANMAFMARSHEALTPEEYSSWCANCRPNSGPTDDCFDLNVERHDTLKHTPYPPERLKHKENDPCTPKEFWKVGT